MENILFENCFAEFAKNLVGGTINTCCPDICAGIIENGKITQEWFTKKDRLKIEEDKLRTNAINDCSTIVIILESPHVDEYNSTKGDKQFINPAMGKTGTNLKKYFHKLITVSSQHNLIDISKNYRIILMNSIQYQCSLGLNPINTIIRDKIWEKLWEIEEENFKGRLKEYAPKYIFNLCTDGDKKRKKREKLQNKVQKAIELIEWENKPTIYRGCHPSSWYSSQNRILKDGKGKKLTNGMVKKCISF